MLSGCRRGAGPEQASQGGAGSVPIDGRCTAQLHHIVASPLVPLTAAATNSSPLTDISPFSPAAALHAIDRRPDRRLSQTFLCEAGVARAMVAVAGIASHDQVLEIGPGLGMLTRELVRTGARVVAVELDRTLAEALPGALRNPENLRVVHADALQTDVAELVEEPFTVVANLPYHVATPLLFKLAFRRPRPRRIVAMVQQEVAQRIVGRGANADFLSVAFGLMAESKIVRRVSPGCFFPMPKVQSAVLRLDLLSEPRVEVDPVERFLDFLHAGFAQPRKQLHNSLGDGLGIDPVEVQEAARRASINPTSRPGALSLGDWVSLYRAVRGSDG